MYRTLANLENISRINLPVLNAFLLRNGWVRAEKTYGFTIIYRHPDDQALELRLPVDNQVADYEESLNEAIRLVSAKMDLDPESVARSINRVNFDTLTFRLSHPYLSKRGLDIVKAKQFLSGIRKAIYSISCSLIEPKPVFKTLYRKEADEFIEHCELERVERGSFLVSVLLPLGAKQAARSPLQWHLHPATLPDSFARAVSIHFANSLAAAVGETSLQLLDRATLNGSELSANFCESLIELDVFDEEDIVDIDVEFGIDHIDQPLLNPIEAAIRDRGQYRIDETVFEKVQGVASALRAVAPVDATVFVGFVDKLMGSPDTDGEMQGDVELSIQLEASEVILARVTLTHSEYQVACDVHKLNRMVRVEGALTRRRRVSVISRLVSFSQL